MERFICENVFVPLRSGPSHRAEMLSQVLFGEKYRILDQAGHWTKVETCFDNYSGWLDMDHLQQSEDSNGNTGLVLNKSLLCFRNDKTRMVLEAGCEIYNPDFANKTFSVGHNIYNTVNEFSDNYITTKDSLTDTALKFINSPYIWGGRIPSGIDCSGFCQLVYKIHGLKIPRDSCQQAEAGKVVSFIDETKPGDLLFFDDDMGRISHVGMLFSGRLIIHASGRVRIDPVDHQGIFKQEMGKYSHHLRTIRRIV
jgi:cell wall-associated NlpC family hydrolase